MRRFKNILVATDTRLDVHPVIDEAAQIAQQNGATLKIMDVVPEFSWIARKKDDELVRMRELYSQEKKEKLEALAIPIRSMGINVETKIMSGKTSVEIIREVLRRDHDLTMTVAKGKNSTRQGFFGQTAIRLLRKCPSAVWLVTPGMRSKSKHVLGCVDVSSDHPSDIELNDKVYELASSTSQYLNARFSILHVWRMEDEALLGRRLSSSEVARHVEEDREYKKKLFDKFLAQFESGIDSENIHLIKGRAPEVISSFVAEHGVDLLVMGTIARTGLLGMLMGNTAEKILDRLECSVLAVKPYNFTSPIRID